MLDRGVGVSESPRVRSGQGRRVLLLVARGLTNKEIGAELRLSEPTVKWHVSSLLAAYGAPNRANLVREAAMRGELGDSVADPSGRAERLVDVGAS